MKMIMILGLISLKNMYGMEEEEINTLPEKTSTDFLEGLEGTNPRQQEVSEKQKQIGGLEVSQRGLEVSQQKSGLPTIQERKVSGITSKGNIDLSEEKLSNKNNILLDTVEKGGDGPLNEEERQIIQTTQGSMDQLNELLGELSEDQEAALNSTALQNIKELFSNLLDSLKSILPKAATAINNLFRKISYAIRKKLGKLSEGESLTETFKKSSYNYYPDDSGISKPYFRPSIYSDADGKLQSLADKFKLTETPQLPANATEEQIEQYKTEFQNYLERANKAIAESDPHLTGKDAFNESGVKVSTKRVPDADSIQERLKSGAQTAADMNSLFPNLPSQSTESTTQTSKGLNLEEDV